MRRPLPPPEPDPARQAAREAAAPPTSPSPQHPPRMTTEKAPAVSHSPSLSSVQQVLATTGQVRRARLRCRSAPACSASSSDLCVQQVRAAGAGHDGAGAQGARPGAGAVKTTRPAAPQRARQGHRPTGGAGAARWCRPPAGQAGPRAYDRALIPKLRAKRVPH